jgi:hypothetical protein
MPSLFTWYRTLRHLKFRQCRHLLWRPLAMAFAKRCKPVPEHWAEALQRGRAVLQPLPVISCCNPDARSFSFLNITQKFPEKIDWNFQNHGLLWAYHLNYFDWLYDDALPLKGRLETMRDFAAATSTRVGNDAYPTSLRIMAWLRFLLRFDVNEEALLRRLFSDADWLCRFPEYQLDGNHLFENALALVAAGVFFGNEHFYKKGSQLLRDCIREQMLPDGAHAEGSPMYHSLLLWHVLQCIEIMRTLPHDDDGLSALLTQTAGRMFGWAEAISFSDGSWPQFNDSTPGIAPDLAMLQQFMTALGISSATVRLAESGYRMLRAGDFELAIHTSAVQPAFQPGHTHADTGSFCLHYRGQPMIVDSSISTYEAGARRLLERSTHAHNTVAVGAENSSEIWRSFRVGGRVARVSLDAQRQEAVLSYSPWAFPRCVHRRRFFLTEDFLRVEDELSGIFPSQSIASLHFSPGLALRPASDKIWLAERLEIRSSEPVRMETCTLSGGFNRIQAAQCARIFFTNRLIIEIVRTRC